MFMRSGVHGGSGKGLVWRWVAAWRRHRRLHRLEPAPWIGWYG
jgi:hypothetical protein